MARIPSKNRWTIASFGTYAFLLVSIFITELAVMNLGAPLLLRLPRLPAALLDAGILVAVFSLPLLLFCQRLKSGEFGNRRSRWSLFLRVLAAIFLIEFMVMLLLPALVPEGHMGRMGLIDALLTLLLSAPPLWWLFRQLELRYRSVPLTDYLNSPLTLFVLLLFMIFLLDLFQELLLPVVLGAQESSSHKAFHAFFTTIFIAPVLWVLVTRPLSRLARSEQARTRAVYAQVVDAVITFDANGLIECFNPGARRIFGGSAEEMAGRPVASLFRDGGRVFERLTRAAVNPVRDSDKVPRFELPGCRRDGTVMTMDVSISRIETREKPEFLLIMRDITERRLADEALQASELRFRQIFEQSDDAIIFLHPRSHAILDINVTTCDMFGYRREELIGKNLSQICSAEDCQRLESLVRRVEKGESSQLENLAGLRKDGIELILSIRCKIMTLLDQDVLYCTVRNVTDRVRMEAEAREIQSKLIQANKMTALGLMVSGVAHEINNPNNFILSNAQMLERIWLDACKIFREYHREQGDFCLGGMPYSQIEAHSPQLFAGIVDGSRRISEIVGNLKSFARKETVSLDGEVDMNQVSRSAVAILRHEIGRLTDHFSFEPGEGALSVRGNRQQLGQVVVNLLMNACQALPDKTRGVKLATFLDPETREVVLTVADEGCGMSPEEGKLIMEPFFTTRLDSGGTGLGLSICRSIVKAHHGSLGFTSEPGRGTTFHLRLPLLEAESKDAPR